MALVEPGSARPMVDAVVGRVDGLGWAASLPWGALRRRIGYFLRRVEEGNGRCSEVVIVIVA